MINKLQQRAKKLFAIAAALLLFSSLAASQDYALNAGDTLRVHVFGEPELTFDELLIGQNGRISYPFLGVLAVAGKSVGEVEDELRAGLSPDYLIDPRVSVSIVEYRPFFVNGEVKNPGAVAFQPGLTLRKAISLAGGFTERANRKRAVVISDSDPDLQEQERKLDYAIQPGDVITVEDTFF